MKLDAQRVLITFTFSFTLGIFSRPLILYDVGGRPFIDLAIPKPILPTFPQPPGNLPPGTWNAPAPAPLDAIRNPPTAPVVPTFPQRGRPIPNKAYTFPLEAPRIPAHDLSAMNVNAQPPIEVTIPLSLRPGSPNGIPQRVGFPQVNQQQPPNHIGQAPPAAPPDLLTPKQQVSNGYLQHSGIAVGPPRGSGPSLAAPLQRPNTAPIQGIPPPPGWAPNAAQRPPDPYIPQRAATLPPPSTLYTDPRNAGPPLSHQPRPPPSPPHLLNNPIPPPRLPSPGLPPPIPKPAYIPPPPPAIPRQDGNPKLPVTPARAPEHQRQIPPSIPPHSPPLNPNPNPIPPPLPHVYSGTGYQLPAQQPPLPLGANRDLRIAQEQSQRSPVSGMPGNRVYGGPADNQRQGGQVGGVDGGLGRGAPVYSLPDGGPGQRKTGELVPVGSQQRGGVKLVPAVVPAPGPVNGGGLARNTYQPEPGVRGYEQQRSPGLLQVGRPTGNGVGVPVNSPQVQGLQGGVTQAAVAPVYPVGLPVNRQPSLLNTSPQMQKQAQAIPPVISTNSNGPGILPGLNPQRGGDTPRPQLPKLAIPAHLSNVAASTKPLGHVQLPPASPQRQPSLPLGSPQSGVGQHAAPYSPGRLQHGGSSLQAVDPLLNGRPQIQPASLPRPPVAPALPQPDLRAPGNTFRANSLPLPKLESPIARPASPYIPAPNPYPAGKQQIPPSQPQRPVHVPQTPSYHPQALPDHRQTPGLPPKSPPQGGMGHVGQRPPIVDLQNVAHNSKVSGLAATLGSGVGSSLGGLRPSSYSPHKAMTLPSSSQHGTSNRPGAAHSQGRKHHQQSGGLSTTGGLHSNAYPPAPAPPPGSIPGDLGQYPDTQQQYPVPASVDVANTGLYAPVSQPIASTYSEPGSLPSTPYDTSGLPADYYQNGPVTDSQGVGLNPAIPGGGQYVDPALPAGTTQTGPVYPQDLATPLLAGQGGEGYGVLDPLTATNGQYGDTGLTATYAPTVLDATLSGYPVDNLAYDQTGVVIPQPVENSLYTDPALAIGGESTVAYPLAPAVGLDGLSSPDYTLPLENSQISSPLLDNVQVAGVDYTDVSASSAGQYNDVALPLSDPYAGLIPPVESQVQGAPLPVAVGQEEPVFGGDVGQGVYGAGAGIQPY